MAQSWKLSDIILSIWLRGKSKTRNFTLLPLHQIRRMHGGPEAFISSFAGALMWHLSAAPGIIPSISERSGSMRVGPLRCLGSSLCLNKRPHWGPLIWSHCSLAFEFTRPAVTRSSFQATWLFDTMKIYRQTRCPISKRLFVFGAKSKRF